MTSHGGGPAARSERSVRRSLAFSVLDRYATLVISIVSTMAIARLLTPAQVGVFSLAMATLSLTAALRDMGAGNYLVQERELTADRIRAVWTVQLSLGLLMAALAAITAVPLGRFYDDESLVVIMFILAVNYLVNPFGSLTYAALMRDMRYDAIAIMRSSSTLAGAVTSITLAWMGFGAASLAWGSLCATAVNAGVSIAYRPADYPWLPGRREVRRVLSFGTKMTGHAVMETLSTATPEWVLAKTQGMTAVGLYSRASGLVALFNRLVTDAVYPVALSVFSQEARAGANYAQHFIRSTALMTVLSWSFCASAAVLAEHAVLVLYGSQWLAAVPLVRWLALASAIGCVVPLCFAALVAAGRLDIALKATAVHSGTTVVLCAGAAFHSLSAVPMALAASALVGTVAWLVGVRQHLRFEWRAVGRATRQGALIASGCAATGAAAMYAVVGWAGPGLVVLVAAGIATVAAFLGLAFALHHPIAAELAPILDKWPLRRRPRITPLPLSRDDS